MTFDFDFQLQEAFEHEIAEKNVPEQEYENEYETVEHETTEYGNTEHENIEYDNTEYDTTEYGNTEHEDVPQPRPVWIRYQNPKPEHSFFRPFGHASLIVGDERGNEEFEESTSLTQFDRYGSKSGPSCKMVGVEPLEAAELPNGWEEFVGYTTRTDEEILSVGETIVGSQPYNLFKNNCADVSQRLGTAITTTDIIDERRGNENIVDYSPFDGLKR